MNDKLQIQITQIENGFLLALPGEVRMTQQGPQMGQPKMTFCNDYNEVCGTLKEVWPRGLVSVSQ